MYYDDSYSKSRLGLASLILLAIFVSAVVLIVVAAVWRPWAEDESAPTLEPPSVTIEEPAADGSGPAELDAAPVNP